MRTCIISAIVGLLVARIIASPVPTEMVHTTGRSGYNSIGTDSRSGYNKRGDVSTAGRSGYNSVDADGRNDYNQRDGWIRLEEAAIIASRRTAGAGTISGIF